MPMIGGRVVSGVGWFPKGWFWQRCPCTKNFLQRVFPCSAILAENAMIFDIPGPPNRNEGTFAKTTLYKAALFFPLDMTLLKPFS